MHPFLFSFFFLKNIIFSKNNFLFLFFLCFVLKKLITNLFCCAAFACNWLRFRLSLACAILRSDRTFLLSFFFLIFFQLFLAAFVKRRNFELLLFLSSFLFLCVGSFVGFCVVFCVVSCIGSCVGSCFGSFVGSFVGSCVGSCIGSYVGLPRFLSPFFLFLLFFSFFQKLF